MALIERTIIDFLRGRQEEITIRFDDEDLIELPCILKYDPDLCGQDGNQVMLIKKVEVKNEDNSWVPYPSITWLDGVEHEGQIVTRALIKKINEKKFSIMSSEDGVPDGLLMSGADRADVYTETIDG